jgi:hypothetical protein
MRKKKMPTPTPPSHDLKHVADDLFRRMDYSSGPINADDVKEKHEHKEHEKKAFADAFIGFLQKLAMGIPPPLPAAARKGIGSAVGQAAKAAVKPPTDFLKNSPWSGAKPPPLPGGGAVFSGGAAHMMKSGADLTPAARAKLPGSDFAVKAKKSNTGKEAYPIPDRQHARSALGFAKMHGDAADLAAVRKKIQAKYPDMLKTAEAFKAAGSLLARLASEGGTHKAELAGLGILAAPSVDDAQAHIRAAVHGEHTEEGVSKRKVLPHAAKPAAELAGLGILAAPSAAHLLGH